MSNIASMYATHGTDDFLHPVMCDENGILAVNIISAPSGGNDVNVINTPDVNIVNQPKVDLNDGDGNPISSAIVGTERGLNVNILSGGGSGGLVQIQGYNGVEWENISASMGNLAVSDYSTHTKLDTLIDKNLNYDVDNVSVNKVVESITYDLNSIGTAMYADSINPAYPDPFGRGGWYWTNTLATGASNVYWYSNTPAQVNQNLMTKAQMDCVFVILALDRVEPNIVLPFLNFYSPPTGTGDIRPLFAHSFWTYTIDITVSRLNAGEIVMLVVGDATKLNNIRPELRRVPLILHSTGGEALQTENIAFISLNTDSGNKPVASIQYLIQYAGFHYSITDKIIQYEFNNSLKRIAENNLSGAVSASGQPNINVNVNTGGFELNVDSNNNLKVIDNTLNNKINSNATYPTAIDVVVLSGGGGGGGDNIGSYANITNNISLTAGSSSTSFFINNTYLNNSVIVYEDTSTTSSSGIAIQISQDDTVWQTLASMFPIVAQTGKRTASLILSLKAFKYIRILNIATTTYNNVICSLYSS